MLTAEQILAATTPEVIFSKDDPDVVKSEFKSLAMHWHSDHNSDPKADDVSAAIIRLYREAIDKIKRGLWEVPGQLTLRTKQGYTHKIKYKTRHDISIGEMYVSKGLVTFMIRKENSDLLDNFVKNTKFEFVNADMKKEFERYFPKVSRLAETEDHHLLYIDKTEDVFALRDVLNAVGKVPGTHVAWILNRLYNITNYLNFYDRTHNDLSLDALFISPSMHTILPLGGWWCATTAKAPLVSLPLRSMNLAPAEMIRTKRASIALDLECIKLLGRELLGDPSGNRMVRDKDVPADMSAFLRHPTSGDPSKDYQAWTQVLRSSYGPAKFIKWKISAEEVYNANRKT